jgi:uncharacterized membrane protein YbhN (UPF0104 family)
MNDAKPLGRSSIWSSILRVALILVAVTPLIFSVVENWADLIEVFTRVSWWRFLISLLILVLVFPLMGILSWIVVRTFKPELGVLLVGRYYFISQIAKYLPGGFWAIPGRALLYVRAGVSQAKAAISVFREISALFIGAAIVAGIGLILGLPISDTLRNIIGVGLIAALLIVLLTQIPIFWGWINKIKWLRPASANLVVEDSERVSISWLVPGCGVSIIFWLLLGLPFRTLILSVAPESIEVSWVEAAAIFSLAWSAGFVVLVAPAGLGIRETVLAVLLSSFIPRADALAVALLARLWWITGETAWIVLSLVTAERSMDG